MKIAIVVEAIPPYCGGGEQVAWIHALNLAKRHEVAVITFGDTPGKSTREGITILSLPRTSKKLLAYSTTRRSLLNRCIDDFSPAIIHCHMPEVLSACLRKGRRLMVSTIHDGIPENEMFARKFNSAVLPWTKYKLVRGLNIAKSDAVTCVSAHNLLVMQQLYPGQHDKFVLIKNPIYERFFSPPSHARGDYVLNFGRQLALKMGALIDVARLMPQTRFVFVGTGEMVKDYGLPNVQFVGFSSAVEEYIDNAALCVFPSLSENFPLVGLEAMARGKPVIATNRGFSEYLTHMHNGYLLESADASVIKDAITYLLNNHDLCERMGREARTTAEEYRAERIVQQYEQLYERLLQAQSNHLGDTTSSRLSNEP